jgi:hypothetical protein
MLKQILRKSTHQRTKIQNLGTKKEIENLARERRQGADKRKNLKCSALNHGNRLSDLTVKREQDC